MQLISKIEINYFRSVYSVTLSSCKDINILMGGNDAGKSNILKALNLFFNNESDLGVPYHFFDDITNFRLEQASDAKGRASIWVKITFNNVFNWESLPKQFAIKKSWNRTSETPDRSWSPQKNGEKKILEQTISKFLNKVSFHYVPAVKGRHIFNYYLGKVYDALLDDVKLGLTSSTSALSVDVEKAVYEMANKIKNNLGFDSTIKVPNDFRSVFESLDFSTKSGGYDVALQHRGDGVQARHIPFILDFIAEKSKKHHIWAYEEPENSLEMAKAFELAEQFHNTFSKDNQIFLTTHSPAFYSLEGGKSSRWLVEADYYLDDGEKKITKAKSVTNNNDADNVLGIADLVKDRAKEAYEALKEQNRQVKQLKNALALLEKPVVLTEGKSDALIIETAWAKIYPHQEMPFEVKSCSTTFDEKSASVSTLAKYLETVLHSEASIKIGVFDRDKAGKEFFYNKLSGFSAWGEQGDIKVHKNARAYAILLPEITDTSEEDYWELKHPCIEFMFSKKYLQAVYVEQSYLLNGVKLKPGAGEHLQEREDLFADQLKIISKPKNNFKRTFSESKAPSFEVEAFVNFRPLFADILKIINDSQEESESAMRV